MVDFELLSSIEGGEEDWDEEDYGDDGDYEEDY